MPLDDNTAFSTNRIRFRDKRMIIFMVIIITGLTLSVNLLLSVGETSEGYSHLRTANEHLNASRDLQIEYDKTLAAIMNFMFLGSEETWNTATEQTNKLLVRAGKLHHTSEHAHDHSHDLHSQNELVNEIESKIGEYISKLPPLRTIRQDFRGVVEGVVTSNIRQSSQHYRVISGMGNAIEILSQDEPIQHDLIIPLQAAQSRWLRIITEFRALLLLRSSRTEQSTLLHVEQFVKQWNEIINNTDQFTLDVQAILQDVDEGQKAWIKSLPLVLNIHMGKRWRRDLRYLEENLNPISDQMLLLLNQYDLSITEHIKETTEEILALEKRNVFRVFIVMALIVTFSLIMLFIYKRLLAAQQRKRMDAERINEMKTEFLSTVSHELRTPLNAIMGFGQLLEMDLESTLSKQQKSNVTEINLASTHLLHLVNEILDLSAIESGNINLNIQKVDVCQVLRESVSLSKNMAEKHNVHISNQATNKVECYVHADAVRLLQIFLNLISNAIKYNTDGGDVLIAISPKQNMTRINISDTGVGISNNDLERLFQPFERLGKPKEIEGAGIGLMVTKELIESMNGRIGVNSTPGKGSTFWVELVTA